MRWIEITIYMFYDQISRSEWAINEYIQFFKIIFNTYAKSNNPVIYWSIDFHHTSLQVRICNFERVLISISISFL